MSRCPYTMVKGWMSWLSLEKKRAHSDLLPEVEAQHLRVIVRRKDTVTVDVSLPARSARWLMELIPNDVMTTIRGEGIPIDEIQNDLAASKTLCQGSIFDLNDENRSVSVWLE